LSYKNKYCHNLANFSQGPLKFSCADFSKQKEIYWKNFIFDEWKFRFFMYVLSWSFWLHPFNDMKWLVAKFASRYVKFCKVIVRVNLLPIGKDLRISSASVKLVWIELDLVEPSGDPNEGKTTWLDETPGSCHGDQISPRVQHITISEKNLFFSGILTSNNFNFWIQKTRLSNWDKIISEDTMDLESHLNLKIAYNVIMKQCKASEGVRMLIKGSSTKVVDTRYRILVESWQTKSLQLVRKTEQGSTRLRSGSRVAIIWINLISVVMRLFWFEKCWTTRCKL